MRGNVNFQVQQLYTLVSNIGESKHAAKEAAKAAGAKGTHEIAKVIGIFSYSTADAYRQTWRELGNFVKSEYNVKSHAFDITKIENTQVHAFIRSKIEGNVAKEYYGKVCAAVEKLEVALNRFAEKNETGIMYDFELQTIRAEGRDLRGPEGNRNYVQPGAVVSLIADPAAKLAASIMYEGGPRISEATYIKESQLMGIGEDRWTGTERGFFHVDSGKGGKGYTVPLSPATYRKLETAISAGGGLFSVDPDSLRHEIEKAAVKAGETYDGKGSHGLRWNCVIERMDELQAAGLTYEQSLTIVSAEKGHTRSSITEHYMGK